MLRRLLVFPAVIALAVGALALPAEAVPASASCRTYTPPAGTIGAGVNSAKICVDLTGPGLNYRRVYVTGTSLLTPTTVTVRYASLLQGTGPGGEQTVVVSNCCGWQGTTYNQSEPVEYTGGSWPVQFGHVYQACAGVGVRGDEGAYDYGTICSFSHVN